MEIAIQGYATTQRFEMDTAYKMIKDAGFGAIDWAIDQEWHDGKQRVCWDRKSIHSGKSVEQDTVYNEDIDKIIESYQPEIDAIKNAGLKITQAHSPFFSYGSKCAEFLENAIETHKKALKLCEYAGCPRLVIHGYSKQISEEKFSEQEINDANMKMYTELIPTALETGVMILLENLFINYEEKRYAGTCCNPYEAIEYIDKLNELAGKECFGLCFDTGHINLVRDSIPEYIRKVGKRIKALHIHDNDGFRDLHLSPYTGSIRWKEVYDSLKEIGYDGDLSFEAFKQLDPKRCDDDMAMPLLRFMYECGDFFRKKIEG